MTPPNAPTKEAVCTRRVVTDVEKGAALANRRRWVMFGRRIAGGVKGDMELSKLLNRIISLGRKESGVNVGNIGGHDEKSRLIWTDEK